MTIDGEREAKHKARIQKESNFSSWYKILGLTTTVKDLVDYCAKNNKPVTIQYNVDDDNYTMGLDMYYQTFKIVAKAGMHRVKVFDELGSSNGPYADRTFAYVMKRFLQKNIKVTEIFNGKTGEFTKNKLHVLEEKLKGNVEDQFYPVPHF